MSSMDSSRQLSLHQQVISSCTGAFITAIFVTPFDVVKVRLQAQQSAMLAQKCYLYCNGLMDHLCSCSPAVCSNTEDPVIKRAIHLNGTVDAFVKISRSEGVKSLWSGLPPTLIVAIPNTIIYLTSYEQTLAALQKGYGVSDTPFWAGALAGSTARAWAVTFVSPFELLRTKMQAKKASYNEIIKVFADQVRHYGPFSLWRGWVATILRDVPFSALYWMSYENLKMGFRQEIPSTSFALAAGAFSGGVAGMLTLPFDVVKTHRQIEIGEKELFAGNGKTRARSTSKIILHIYSQQGIGGLFTGIVPRLAKVMPACAIMISTYEYAKNYFRRKNKQDGGL